MVCAIIYLKMDRRHSSFRAKDGREDVNAQREHIRTPYLVTYICQGVKVQGPKYSSKEKHL